VHESREVELYGIFRCIVMINKVVYNRSNIVVHGFKNVSSWDNKGNLLCKILCVFDHVASFVNCLLYKIELLHS